MPEKTVHGPGDEHAWEVRRAGLLQLQSWHVDGRVAIAAGEDGWSGSLSWEQDKDHVDFRFNGPFGIGGLRITGNGRELLVKTSRGDSFLTTDPEEDFQERLGWSIPIRSMRYWMAGIPDPGAGYQKTIDGEGRLVELEQEGWQVDYKSYGRVGSLQLPTRLTIRRPAVRIKLAIDQWTVNPPGRAVADDYPDI